VRCIRPIADAMLRDALSLLRPRATKRMSELLSSARRIEARGAFPAQTKARSARIEPRHARACPAHPRLWRRDQGVDGRAKPGHDELGSGFIGTCCSNGQGRVGLCWWARQERPASVSPTTWLREQGDVGFSRAFLIRMLFSCLVDADFLETERFYAKAKSERLERGGTFAGFESCCPASQCGLCQASPDMENPGAPYYVVWSPRFQSEAGAGMTVLHFLHVRNSSDP
jgi:hypothetical protein